MFSSKSTLATLSLAALAAVLGACANETTMTERNYGESVRQMIRAQTYDPSTLESPALDAPNETDGQLLEGVMEVYRTDVGQPEAVSNDIVINVGGGQ
jgi:hypothetical protein